MDDAGKNTGPIGGFEITGRIIPLIRVTFLLLFVILFIHAITAARNFLFPIAFGALFSYLLYPIASYLELKGVARILAIIISILIAVMIIASIFWVFSWQLNNMFDDIGQLKSQINTNIELLQKNLTSLFGMKDNSIELYLKDRAGQFLNGDASQIRRTFTATTGTIFRIILLPIYIFLFLFYRTKIAYFILKVVPDDQKKDTIQILREISTIAAKYMGGVTIVVLILCVLNSTGLAIIGVEYAILLGIASAFFNFIPYFGTLMGGLVPFLFVLLTTEQPLYFGLRVAILFLLIQFTENYIMTPNIVGGNVRINPMFIIIGLIAGAMIWGIPGMLVIVPFLAILKIVFSHIPRMEPYAFLLGLQGTGKHSLKLARIKKTLLFRRDKKTQDENHTT